MKTRFLALFLIFAAALSCFSGCAGGKTEQTQTNDPKPETTIDQPPETTADTTPETTAVPFVPQQRQELPYETLLAAAVLTGLSMQYPECLLEGLYCDAPHDMENKMESGGVYAFFTLDGQGWCIHAVPLAEGRSEAGTVDLYENYLGYATFDMSREQTLPEGYAALADEEVSAALGQLYLLSVIEN